MIPKEILLLKAIQTDRELGIDAEGLSIEILPNI